MIERELLDANSIKNRSKMQRLAPEKFKGISLYVRQPGRPPSPLEMTNGSHDDSMKLKIRIKCRLTMQKSRN
jgi:hypothetical protein